jgi:U3 small nucleolar RNA-associated protein 12
MLIKFWDIGTRHCFKTIISHRSEVNALLVLNNETRVLAGSQDNELRVYGLKYDEEIATNDTTENQLDSDAKKSKNNNRGNDEKEQSGSTDEISDTSDPYGLLCDYMGSIIRESKDSLFQLTADRTNTFISSHSNNEKHIELYKVLSEEETQQCLSKKIKKQLKTEKSKDAESHKREDTATVSLSVQDEIKKICTIKADFKIKYVDISSAVVVEKSGRKGKEAENKSQQQQQQKDKTTEVIVACSLQNNVVQVYRVVVNKRLECVEGPTLIYTIENQSHRSDVRTVCFNSDSTRFVTGSGESLKVWNRTSLKSIRTFACDYALCSLFLSDNDHILVGTKVFRI